MSGGDFHHLQRDQNINQKHCCMHATAILPISELPLTYKPDMWAAQCFAPTAYTFRLELKISLVEREAFEELRSKWRQLIGREGGIGTKCCVVIGDWPMPFRSKLYPCKEWRREHDGWDEIG